MILATVRYEIPIDHCKRVWHKNAIKTPACLLVRAELKKLNSFKPTLPITKSVSSRKNTAIKSSMLVQRKRRRFTCTCTTTIMTSSPRCLDFSPAFTIAIRARKPTIIRKSIGARVRANVVGFLPSALKCPGKLVKIVIGCSRASSVTNNINNLEVMPNPFAKV